MREIKLRVWNPRHKMFTIWGFIKEMFCGIPTGAGLTIDYCAKYSQQYTGLKDKNGKEIYEGDIIKHKKEFNETDLILYGMTQGLMGDRPQVVEYESAGFVPLYGWNQKAIIGMGFEIIGNTYENPELLTGREKDGKGISG